MKRLLPNFKRSFSQRGDTIIEVLISIAILALVLTVSYVSTNSSFHEGSEATSREQALSIAQQQIEIIKNAQSSLAAAFNAYDGYGKAFCIPDPTQISTPTQYGLVDATNSKCASVDANYAISDTYNNGLFTVNAKWASGVSADTNQLQVYFRVPEAGDFGSSGSPSSGSPSSGSPSSGTPSSSGGNSAKPTCFITPTVSGNELTNLGGDCQPVDGNGSTWSSSGSANETCLPGTDTSVCTAAGGQPLTVRCATNTGTCAFSPTSSLYTFAAGSRHAQLTISGCNANGCTTYTTGTITW